jgi:ubiquinone/menaquinone biosynthesis C-methylase UbiE
MSDFLVSDYLKKNYDDYYVKGESQWRWIGALDKVDNIVTLSKDYPHNKILEIGAGEGSILQQLNDRNFGENLYALEISTSAIENIKKRNISSLVDCNLFDGYSIPYKNKKFDLVILSHILEHVEYPRKLIYEAKRVADYVFIEVPLEDTFRLKQDFVFDKVGHINFYSRKSIRRLVQSCELDVLNQIVHTPSKRIYQYSLGKTKGAIKHFVKQLTFQIIPSLAPNIWIYHSAIICKV